MKWINNVFRYWNLCFAWFYGVLVQSIPPISFILLWLWRIDQTMCSDNFGGVFLWCWNLCFRITLWCFNPVDTMRETDYGFRQFWGVFLWKSLYNSSIHLSNSQGHKMTFGNLILDDPVHTLLSENKPMSKLHCQRWNYLKEFLHVRAEPIKTEFNLMSMFCYSNNHKIISLPHPRPFESVFCGYMHLRRSFNRI